MRSTEPITRLCWQVFTILMVTAVPAIVGPVAANAGGASPVASLLVKSGEMGGFEPGKPQVFRTVVAVRDAAGTKLTHDEANRYETEGFVSAAIVRIHSHTEPAARGISSVALFEAPAGAKAEMTAEVKQGLDPQVLRTVKNHQFILERFEVPGVPHAVAFAVVPSDSMRNRGSVFGIAKALFLRGKCFYTIGVYRPKNVDVRRPVIRGVQAISKRVGEPCF